MTKKQLTTKLTDYQTQLNKATEKEINMRNYIEHLEKDVEVLNNVINNLRDDLNEFEIRLSERLDFEQSLVEIFTKIINDYQGA